MNLVWDLLFKATCHYTQVSLFPSHKHRKLYVTPKYFNSLQISRAYKRLVNIALKSEKLDKIMNDFKILYFLCLTAILLAPMCATGWGFSSEQNKHRSLICWGTFAT